MSARDCWGGGTHHPAGRFRVRRLALGCSTLRRIRVHRARSGLRACAARSAGRQAPSAPPAGRNRSVAGPAGLHGGVPRPPDRPGRVDGRGFGGRQRGLRLDTALEHLVQALDGVRGPRCPLRSSVSSILAASQTGRKSDGRRRKANRRSLASSRLVATAGRSRSRFRYLRCWNTGGGSAAATCAGTPGGGPARPWAYRRRSCQCSSPPSPLRGPSPVQRYAETPGGNAASIRSRPALPSVMRKYRRRQSVSEGASRLRPQGCAQAAPGQAVQRLGTRLGDRASGQNLAVLLPS